MKDEELIAFFAMMASSNDIERFQEIKLEISHRPSMWQGFPRQHIKKTPTYSEDEARLRYAKHFLSEYKKFLNYNNV